MVLALGLIVLASFISFTPYDLSFYTSSPNNPPQNLIRGFGAYLAGFLLLLFGWPAYLIPLMVLGQGVGLFRQQSVDIRLPRLLGFLIFLISTSCICAMLSISRGNFIQFSGGGILGFLLSSFLINYFGRLGSYIIFFTFTILSFTLLTQVLLSTTFLRIKEKIRSLFKPLCGFLRLGNLWPKIFSKKKSR